MDSISVLKEAIEDATKENSKIDREIGHHQRTILGLQDEISSLLEEIDNRKQRISDVREGIVAETERKMANLQTIKTLEWVINEIL